MPKLIIPGPEGRIEARYEGNDDESAPIALILHPHPQHNGTMDNTVTFLMFHTFVNAGFNVLRFNFRGVGASEGEYDRGEGELSDAATALDWLQTHRPNARGCWVAGYDFGAWIGMQLLMRRPEINAFISVSPPANLYDFTFLAPCPNSGLFIQGNQDDFVPQDQVFKLVEKLRAQRGIDIDYHVIEGANHFFTGKEKELEGSIRSYIEAAPQLLPPEEEEEPEVEVEDEHVEMDFDELLDSMDAENGETADEG